MPVYRGRWTGKCWDAGGRQDKVMALYHWGAAATAEADRPAEESDQGCLGGWYRCGFAQSFIKYRRPIIFSDYGGVAGRQDNPLIHGRTSRRVLDLLSYFEDQERAAIHRYHEMKDQMEA